MLTHQMLAACFFMFSVKTIWLPQIIQTNILIIVITAFNFNQNFTILTVNLTMWCSISKNCNHLFISLIRTIVNPKATFLFYLNAPRRDQNFVLIYHTFMKAAPKKRSFFNPHFSQLLVGKLYRNHLSPGSRNFVSVLMHQSDLV